MLSVTDPTPFPPCPSPFNLAQYVLWHANAADDKPALEVYGKGPPQVWSYGQLRTAVEGVAGGLLGRGLSPGDRILIRIGNAVEFPIAFLGSIYAGLVPVPTSAQLTVPEVNVLTDIIQPVAVFAAPNIALPEPCPAVISTEELRAMEDGPGTGADLGDPNRPGYVVCTSGTMAGPKPVLHAHRAIWARRMMIDGWYGLNANDRVMHAGAFNWTYTLGTGLLDPWAAGATALVVAPDTETTELIPFIAASKATIFAAAPGVYRQMLRDSAEFPLPTLRHGLSAGEKLPDAVRAAWEAATDTLVHEAFGMSECSTFVSGSPEHPAPVGTLGFPQPGRRIAVLGQTGEPVRQGEPGLISVHRSDPGLMLGYLNEPARDDAWFRTGDVVTMHVDGSIEYLGRNDDMLNAGGYRVSPLEIEAALSAHPDVIEAAAVEEEIKPGVCVIAAHYVALRPLDETQLSAHMEKRLARYKCPRLYHHQSSLPRSANGKLVRRALQPEAP